MEENKANDTENSGDNPNSKEEAPDKEQTKSEEISTTAEESAVESSENEKSEKTSENEQKTEVEPAPAASPLEDSGETSDSNAVEEEKVEPPAIPEEGTEEPAQEAPPDGNDALNAEANALNENIPNEVPPEAAELAPEAAAAEPPAPPPTPSPRAFFRLHYTQISLLAANMLLWYTLRTRREFYPTMIFLSSSKLSYIVFGNAVAAAAFSVFHILCKIFLNGLRLAEREAIADGMRWSMTDTCLALTMFREEVSLNMGGMFLLLIMCKCWHWAVELRGKHLIQTEEAVAAHSTYVYIPYAHCKYLLFLVLLGAADVLGVFYCAVKCFDDGPSVHILFGFEAMILLISAATNIDLYMLHFFDGVINAANHKYPSFSLLHRLASLWRDSKLTLTLGVDLVAHAAKFLSYLFLFFIVFTYYGLPINIFREVYMASQDFRKKILLFAGYRRLTHLMEQKFHTLCTAAELDEAGHVCIICRDAMHIEESPKKLPGCGHVFHPYCLKGWLMQQQSCPTCRRDIMTAVKEEARLESLGNLERANAANEDGNIQPSAEAPAANDGVQPQAAPEADSKPSDKQPPSNPVFPCLYKVTNPTGADIIDASRTVKRTVPPNSIILCTEMKWWRPQDNPPEDNNTTPVTGNDTGSGEMMLLMPDGWVKDKDLKRMLPVPIPLIRGVEREVVSEGIAAT